MDPKHVRLHVLIAIASCSSGPAPEPATKRAADVPRDAAPAHAVAAPKRWLAGDLHMHIAPHDGDADALLAQIVESAKQAKMDFLVITPHLGEGAWQARRDDQQRAWRAFARDVREVKAPLLVPGAEWSTGRGHFTVLGADLSAIERSDFLEGAHAAGAYISVNHPFAVPTHMPGVEISEFDLSYRVWSQRAHGFTAIDGAEVWNVPLGLANVVSRPGGLTGERRAWSELDRVVHEEHRRVTAVGGSDDHHGHAMPTTWLLASEVSEAAIVAALRAGATCVGGPEAGTLRARGDGDWVGIGGTVSGPQVTLTWTGTATVFVDDVDRGEHAGQFTHDTGGKLHTYRIELGPSRSGFIYANL